MSVVEIFSACASDMPQALRHRTPQSTKRPRELPAFGARWERVERKPSVKYMSNTFVKVLVRALIACVALTLDVFN
jgi:hypothetical protein